MGVIRALASRIARGVRGQKTSAPPAPEPASARQSAAQPSSTGQQVTSAEYWTDFNVTLHHQFSSPHESLDYFHWRNDQYPGYLELMPVSGQDDKVVLDYGCGPGHDVIGFGVYSKPRQLIAADVSPSSLAEAQHRARLHGLNVRFVRINEGDNRLPIDSGSVDYIHSSGVIHHIADPLKALRELRRVLAPAGRMRVMVYNYHSIWLHYYVGYALRVKTDAYPGLTLRQVFTKTTDGENCPISNVYKPEEFCALASEAGFACRFLGAGISNFELKLFPERFDAIMDRRLPAEHRDFLKTLEVDRRGYPLHRGHYAGIDGCFELMPA
jgi:SAM-dependent methyltransferase